MQYKNKKIPSIKYSYGEVSVCVCKGDDELSIRASGLREITLSALKKRLNENVSINLTELKGTHAYSLFTSTRGQFVQSYVEWYACSIDFDIYKYNL